MDEDEMDEDDEDVRFDELKIKTMTIGHFGSRLI